MGLVIYGAAEVEEWGGDRRQVGGENVETKRDVWRSERGGKNLEVE